MPKHQARPACQHDRCDRRPMMRARLNPPELSAIASTMSSRETSSTISDCRAGISNAEMTPPIDGRGSRSHSTSSCPSTSATKARPPRRAGAIWQIDDDVELAASVGDHAAIEREQQHWKVPPRLRGRRRRRCSSARAQATPAPPAASRCRSARQSARIQNSRKFRWIWSARNGLSDLAAGQAFQ